MPPMPSTDALISAAMAQYPRANLTAVQNFCWTAPFDPAANAWNIAEDARLYGWNNDTIDAITYVLRQERKI